MCAMCGNSPCVNRCPNALEIKPVYKCSKCGDGIAEGEKYYDSPKGEICETCIDNMTVYEFMELIGEILTTAE